MTDLHPLRDELRAAPKRVPFERVKLTPDQERKYQIALAYLLIRAPFFADLLMSRLALIPTRVPQVPIAATDATAVFINPDTFFRYETPEQAFIIAHEVMHCVLNDIAMLHVWTHAGKVLCPTLGPVPFDADLMGKAMDYVINAILIQGQVGKFNADWLYDRAISDGTGTCVHAYEKLWREQESGGGGGGSGNSGSGNGQFDAHLPPGEGKGQEPDTAAAERNEAEWRVAVAAAAQAAKAQGKLPESLQRFIGDILEPKVTWQERIKSQMHRRLGADGFDWTQLDEWYLNRPKPYEMICFPQETAYGCGHIVVGCDTSGSMDDDETRSRIFSEMAGIVADLNPRQLTVLWCDADIGRSDELEEPEDLATYKIQLDEEGVNGGGGTSFVPVFDEIRRLGHQPDILVYFTDLMGKFPSQEPPYPVVWGVIGPKRAAPFGDIVEVEL